MTSESLYALILQAQNTQSEGVGSLYQALLLALHHLFLGKLFSEDSRASNETLAIQTKGQLVLMRNGLEMAKGQNRRGWERVMAAAQMLSEAMSPTPHMLPEDDSSHKLAGREWWYTPDSSRYHPQHLTIIDTVTGTVNIGHNYAARDPLYETPSYTYLPNPNDIYTPSSPIIAEAEAVYDPVYGEQGGGSDVDSIDWVEESIIYPPELFASGSRTSPFTLEPPAQPPTPDASYIPHNGHDIFISYSHENAANMERLLIRFQDVGLSVWADTQIPPGSETWVGLVEREIKAAGCVIVLMSPAAHQSKWVEREIEFAQHFDKLIIPLLVDGDVRDSVPLPLSSHHMTDVRTPAQYRTQLHALTQHLRARLLRPAH